MKAAPSPSAAAVLERPALRVKKRVRPAKTADRHQMGDQMAKPAAREPGVKVEGRWLGEERGPARFDQVKIDRVIGRGADACGHPAKYGGHRAMNVAGGNQPNARVTGHHSRQIAGVLQVLPIQVGDSGGERRMV